MYAAPIRRTLPVANSKRANQKEGRNQRSSGRSEQSSHPGWHLRFRASYGADCLLLHLEVSIGTARVLLDGPSSDSHRAEPHAEDPGLSVRSPRE